MVERPNPNQAALGINEGHVANIVVDYLRY